MIKLLDNTKTLLDKEIDPAFARRARIILENLDLKKGMKLLDIGCGRGFYEAAISLSNNQVHITGIDMNRDYLKKGRAALKELKINNIVLKEGDATKLDFPKNSFDYIICSEVLEHIPDDDKVISEIYRVLKPNGKALITVPVKNYPFFWDPVNFILEKLFRFHLPSSIWWLSGIWADHVRLYNSNVLKKRLITTGFKNTKIWEATHTCLPFSHFILYGLGKNMVERGLVKGSFNRFDFKSKPSILFRLVKGVFQLGDQFNNNGRKGRRYLNLIINTQK